MIKEFKESVNTFIIKIKLKIINMRNMKENITRLLPINENKTQIIQN